VDSEDLPLNISRETIQHSPIIEKIRKSLVKKVLSELSHKAKAQPDEYSKFWENFGEVLKEGLCEPALEEKEQILEICRFHSSKSDNTISLDDYISQMLESQEQIFYITGEDLEKLRNHPTLEGFKKRGIEVLLLDEYVDDFWVNVINVYKNNELKSISHSNIDLDSIVPMDISGADKESKTSNEDGLALQERNDKIIATFKGILGGHVQDVAISKKLVGSPACLAIPEGYMSTRMEKMLIEQKQLNKAAAKILEINPEHKIISKIANLANDNSQSEELSNLVWLVYDQACLLEGDKIFDPKACVERINTFLVG
jgi:molecular chaperone HtpG